MSKYIFLAVSSVIASIGFFMLIVEISFRFLPVFEGVYLEPVNQEHPVARMQSNRFMTYSSGWKMERSNVNRINNEGFVNNHDYLSNEGNAKMAIIGDSYVESLMLPHVDTIQGQLGRSLKSEAVYSFGISGAAMSQYLVWAQYAQRVFGTESLVFVIVATDFDESLLKHRARTGFHYFDGDIENCNLELIRLDHHPNPLRPLLRISAFLQYLVFNLGILEGEVWQSWLRSFSTGNFKSFEIDTQSIDSKNEGSGHHSLEINRISESNCAIKTFFRLLPGMTKLTQDNIIFVLDGIRARSIRDRQVAQQGYFGRMRQTFLREANERGYYVIDLDPYFRNLNIEEYVIQNDVHWNARAHSIIAEQIANSSLFKGVSLVP